MIDFIPYLAGIVTILFSVAFSYAITDGWDFKDKKRWLILIASGINSMIQIGKNGGLLFGQ